MRKPSAALLGLLLLPAVLHARPGLDRIEAWQTVETYKLKQQMNMRSYAQWAHQPGNESKSRAEAEAALGLEKLDPLPAVEAAVGIAEANPVDDLGFLALRFVFGELRSLPAAERQKFSGTVFGLLERHYLNDLRLNAMLLSLVRFGGDAGVDLVDKVVAGSTERLLRARGAYWSASDRMMQVDDLRATAARRAAVREEVTRMARLVADEYGDVEVWGSKTGREAIKPVLYALEHLAIGSELPDASAQRIGGSEERLSQYRGKVVLLDFWATWCVPCVASLPKVVKLKELLRDQDFEVVTLSIDKEMKTAQQFMDRRMKMPFVNWHIGDQSQLYRDWGINGVPTYILVDEQGIVRGRTHDVESLYDVVLDLTGAGSEVRAKLAAK